MLRWHDEDSRPDSFPPFDSGSNEAAREYSNRLIQILVVRRRIELLLPERKSGGLTASRTHQKKRGVDPTERDPLRVFATKILEASNVSHADY